MGCQFVCNPLFWGGLGWAKKRSSQGTPFSANENWDSPPNLGRRLPCPPSIAPTPAAPRPRSVLKYSTACRRITSTPKRGSWAASCWTRTWPTTWHGRPARRFLCRGQPEALRPPAGDARRGAADRRHAAVGAAPLGRRSRGRRRGRLSGRGRPRVPYAANAVYYAGIVRDKATLRALDPRQHRNPPRRLRADARSRANWSAGPRSRSSPSTTSGAPTRSPPPTT